MMYRGLLLACLLSIAVPAQAANVKIGVLAPFSGDYATYGEGYEKGIEVWKEMYGAPKAGNQPIEIQKIDGRCDVNTALAAFRREASSLTMLIGPACSGAVRAATPLIDAGHIPSLVLGLATVITANRKPDGYVFRVLQDNDSLDRRFGEFIMSRWQSEGRKKIGLLLDSSANRVGTAKIWTELAKGHGAEVVASEKFELGSKDFTSQLVRLKASGAQAAVILGYAADEGRLLRQMSEQGFDLPIAGGNDTPYLPSLDPSLVKDGSKILENVFFYSSFVPGEDTKEVKKFVDHFQTKYKTAPLDIDYAGWLALTIAVKAMNNAGGDLSGPHLRQALQDMKLDLGGRAISYTKTGDQQQGLLYVGQLKNGKPSLVKLLTYNRD